MTTRPFDLAEVARWTEAAAEGDEPAPLEVQLRDGSRALLRPVKPEDKERLRRGLAMLSSRSRYLRFLRPVQELTDDELRYLTEVDHRDHVAWIALDPDNPDVAGMGIGRYVRLSGAPSVAEAAITVADRYQGRGLGTLLLAVLAVVARANDVHVFRNYVLADNTEMLELFDQLGATRQRCASGVYEVDFPLPADPDELPDTPAGRAIRAFAQQRTLPSRLTSVLLPLWIRELRRRGDVPSRCREPGSSGGREDDMLAEWVDAALAPREKREASQD